MKLLLKPSPANITKLKPNEVFVFGSNEAGIHGARAAKQALEEFGAIMGQGFGLFGNSYAIPTKDRSIQTLPRLKIKFFVHGFLNYAFMYRNKKFLVTEIGCGLAGYQPEDIAPFFEKMYDYKIKNVYLPQRFIDVLVKLYPDKFKCSKKPK